MALKLLVAGSSATAALSVSSVPLTQRILDFQSLTEAKVGRFVRLFEEQPGPCDADPTEWMNAPECSGMMELFIGMGGDGSGSMSQEAMLKFMTKFCDLAPCLITVADLSQKKAATAECQAEVNACSEAKPESFTCAPTNCEYDMGGDVCVHSSSGMGEMLDNISMMCAINANGETCLEAVILPIMSAFTAEGSGTDLASFAGDCGAPPAASASKAEQDAFGCCVVEDWGCCVAMFSAAGESIDVTAECPEIGVVSKCPNPFLDVTYLTFELTVSCVTDEKQAALFGLDLAKAFDMDSGLVTTHFLEEGKVKVKVTVPQDEKSADVTAKIKNAVVVLSAVEGYTGKDCTLGDIKEVVITEQVVAAGTPASSAATVVVGSIAALLLLF